MWLQCIGGPAKGREGSRLLACCGEWGPGLDCKGLQRKLP